MQQTQTTNEPSVQSSQSQQPAIVVLDSDALSRVVGGMSVGPGAGWASSVATGPGTGW